MMKYGINIYFLNVEMMWGLNISTFGSPTCFSKSLENGCYQIIEIYLVICLVGCATLMSVVLINCRIFTFLFPFFTVSFGVKYEMHLYILQQRNNVNVK